MTDYLGNLIGKSFGQASVVKPRRAPLFAPSPYVAGALAQAAANTPAADGPLPSRRAEVSTQEQPIAAASDAQEPPDRGQWLTVSTDSITAIGTADAPATLSPGLQVAPIARTEEPESPASDLSPARRVRTRRQSDSAGQEQTPPQPGRVSPQDHAASQPQRRNITPRSEGGDFEPSETPRKSQTSAIQGEQARYDQTNQLITQDRSARSSDNTRAVAPDMPPVDLDDPQRRSAASAPLRETPRLQPIAAQSPRTIHTDRTARALDPSTSSVSSMSRLAEVDRGAQTVEDLPGQVALESHRPRRPGSMPGAVANQARLATIRIAAPGASVTAHDAAVGGDAEPARIETNLMPGETRPVSATHPLSPARLAGVPIVQPTPLQSSGTQRTVSDSGPAPEQAAAALRPALRSAKQEEPREPHPVAVRMSSRPGAASDNAPAPGQQTIHVTIGRIEVRATPPSSAPPRKQSAAPVMSLEEYLKTRSGGKR